MEYVDREKLAPGPTHIMNVEFNGGYDEDDGMVVVRASTIRNAKDFIDYNAEIKGKWAEQYICR